MKWHVFIYWSWAFTVVFGEQLLSFFELQYDDGNFGRQLIWWVAGIASWPQWVASEALFSLGLHSNDTTTTILRFTLVILQIVLVFFFIKWVAFLIKKRKEPEY